MAWDHLSVNKPHLVYIILGGFTTLFMLCSSIIKERLYIGEATVATLCGIIFGPHAADLINPLTWGNTDQITLEFARIVLVVQCFAVGVELPKAYMERHWRSVVFLLVPVMTFGWLITSLFIWALFHAHADWLDSLCIAACVTATDPVLASSVVGKGKFAKRVPKHLRDLLSAESGCNDGMAFPFIYLALYVIRYRYQPDHVALHWICVTILYECIFGAIYGVTIGYIARRLIRFAHERDYIDRESFLVFYFVLALFCAGSGSLLGMDDLLIGFACGVGFSNDGWFTEKTEESSVSNVIDLLINLAFFVYFGTIIPWDQYNAGMLSLDVWRLVVIAFLVLFFRRIPIMMVLKPLIPDIKTWREALFAGHFGPIGVGAIFVAILARAELESGEEGGSTPLAVLPAPGFPHRNIIELIWPITTFLVLTSIVVHGSSIAVFTLGKHINTLTLTMSYTKGMEEPTWMDRLPRIQSRSKSSMSMQRSDSEVDEKNIIPPAALPLSAAGQFLRRQKEEDNPSRVQSRSSSRHRSKRGKIADSIRVRGPGGPVSRSAIAPQPRRQSPSPRETWSRSNSDTLAMKSDPPSTEEKKQEAGPERGRQEATSPGEIYEEGDKTIYEDEEGNVLDVQPSRGEGQEERQESEVREGRRLMREQGAEQNDGVAPTKDNPDFDLAERVKEEFKAAEEKAKSKDDGPVEHSSERAGRRWGQGMQKMRHMGLLRPSEGSPKAERKPEAERDPQRSAARAYQFGNTIILEDADGEVIKKFDIPGPERKQSAATGQIPTLARLRNTGKMFHLGHGPKDGKAQGDAPGPSSTGSPPAQPADRKPDNENTSDDERMRFVSGGRRMSKAQLIDEFRGMNTMKRMQSSDASGVPQLVRRDTTRAALPPEVSAVAEQPEYEDTMATLEPVRTNASEEQDQGVPYHDVSRELRAYQIRSATGETAAERRRRQAVQEPTAESDSDDDGTERVPPIARHAGPSSQHDRKESDQIETAAERRRREGALGLREQVEDSDSDEEDEPRQIPAQRQNIRFADTPSPQQARPERHSALRWGKNVGR